MEKFSPFISWLRRGSNLTTLYEPDLANPKFELGGFLSLSSATPLYKAGKIRAESLKSSWTSAKRYTNDVRDFLNLDDDIDLQCLDNEEIDWINEDAILRNPPPIAHPIYFMTVRGDNKPEKIEYIGKTSSNNARFRGGHSAITRLHAPEYNGLEKNIYLASILFIVDNKDLLPIEWVHPIEKAEKLLTQIESQLITHFQPKLNIKGKNQNLMVNYIQLHIQNQYDSMFLHDTFC